MEQRSRDASGAQQYFCANVVLLRLICSAARSPENVVWKNIPWRSIKQRERPNENAALCCPMVLLRRLATEKAVHHRMVLTSRA